MYFGLDIWWLCRILSVFYFFIQLSDMHFAFLVKLLCKKSHLSLSENINTCKKVLLYPLEHISFRKNEKHFGIAFVFDLCFFWNVWVGIIFRSHRILKENDSLSSPKKNVIVEFWSLIAVLWLRGLVINML